MNCGTEGADVAEKINNQPHPNFGFNVMTEHYEDLVRARRYRSHQGDSHGSAECGFDPLSYAHRRGHDLRRCGASRRLVAGRSAGQGDGWANDC